MEELYLSFLKMKNHIEQQEYYFSPDMPEIEVNKDGRYEKEIRLDTTDRADN